MPVSRRQWNATYGAVSGPSRDGPCEGAIRPSATVPDAAPRVGHCQAHGGPEGGLWRGDWPEGGPGILQADLQLPSNGETLQATISRRRHPLG
jgi:hypothetical protein